MGDQENGVKLNETHFPLNPTDSELQGVCLVLDHR